MKTILLIVTLLAGGSLLAQNPLTSSVATTSVAARNSAFHWIETTHDFGSIALGVPVTHDFEFTNNGDSPLLIQSVRASCGCTVTNYSKDPVMPGGKGRVSATYNAAKAGVFNKTVTVVANVDEAEIRLTITGTVINK